MRSRSRRAVGPGFAVLEHVAASQGAEIEESWLFKRGRATDREARLRIGKLRFVWATNGREHYLSLRTPDVAVRLAIGEEDPARGYSRPVRNVGRVPVYVEEEFVIEQRELIEYSLSWLEDEANVRLLERLDITRGEWFTISAGWSLASLIARGDGDQDRVQHIIEIIDAATDRSAPWLHEPRLLAKTFPDEFQELLPLVRKWAIDDDVFRSERMDQARTSTLLALWSAVGPRLGEIDAYLTRVGDSASYEALKVGRLAEATAEARIELERRGVDPSMRNPSSA